MVLATMSPWRLPNSWRDTASRLWYCVPSVKAIRPPTEDALKWCLWIENAIASRSVLDVLSAKATPRSNDLASKGTSQITGALFRQLEGTELREPFVAS